MIEILNWFDTDAHFGALILVLCIVGFTLRGMFGSRCRCDCDD